MAKLWSDFFPYVQPFVPGAPEGVIEAHIAEAAKEFCARSEVWRSDITLTTEDGVADYTLTLPSNTLLENILFLSIGAVPLSRTTTLHYLDNYFDNNLPEKYALLGNGDIRFFATPNQAFNVRGIAVLKPSDSAYAVDNYIFDHHGRAISYGALARLMGTPRKEWSDPAMAGVYSAKFLAEADNAKGRERQRANLSVKPIKFA